MDFSGIPHSWRIIVLFWLDWQGFQTITCRIVQIYQGHHLKISSSEIFITCPPHTSCQFPWVLERVDKLPDNFPILSELTWTSIGIQEKSIQHAHLTYTTCMISRFYPPKYHQFWWKLIPDRWQRRDPIFGCVLSLLEVLCWWQWNPALTLERYFIPWVI